MADYCWPPTSLYLFSFQCWWLWETTNRLKSINNKCFIYITTCRPAKCLVRMCHSRILSPSKASEPPTLFPHHFPRAEMFALRRSDENKPERKFLPARFASRVQHRLGCARTHDMGQFFYFKNKLRHPDVIYRRWSTHVSWALAWMLSRYVMKCWELRDSPPDFSQRWQEIRQRRKTRALLCTFVLWFNG